MTRAAAGRRLDAAALTAPSYALRKNFSSYIGSPAAAAKAGSSAPRGESAPPGGGDAAAVDAGERGDASGSAPSLPSLPPRALSPMAAPVPAKYQSVRASTGTPRTQPLAAAGASSSPSAARSAAVTAPPCGTRKKTRYSHTMAQMPGAGQAAGACRADARQDEEGSELCQTTKSQFQKGKRNGGLF